MFFFRFFFRKICCNKFGCYPRHPSKASGGVWSGYRNRMQLRNWVDFELDLEFDVDFGVDFDLEEGWNPGIESRLSRGNY